jgi:hypothetical protein
MCGRILSIALKGDVDIRKVIKSCKGIRCHDSSDENASCPDAVCEALEKFLEDKHNEKQTGVPD